ncbi:UvrD-helicase domain-containing protein [Ruegeria arenilitoris]|uniref:UvrD-helicase domain-containing protein n=1 Tax=Ruegeria arenilitoris TaxID=1173585 RepID=UPI001481B249|nr:ATP-dependent helicase [Ruegeria arenilitoris]
MNLTEKQLEVMAADGQMLVTGGPGSGKTTVSILKAAQMADRDFGPQQKVLFLSFARASVSRVVEAIEKEKSIGKDTKRKIEVETYHSFFWRILKAHGYLLGLPRRLSILTPPAEAIALSVIRSSYKSESKLSNEEKNAKQEAERTERKRLAFEEGKVCFDLFAPFVGELLHGSARLRKLLATRYPAIILDEFQDTNAEQWYVVQALGTDAKLIALADPEQRIFDFIGADPERLNHFREAYNPTEIDFSDANHRSAGTDIAKFGNDLLKGSFEQQKYSGIDVQVFEPFLDQAMTKLVTMTYEARSRVVASNKEDWSIAVLVPTKKMTRAVSDKFREPPAEMQAIPHTAVVELEAAILGSEIVAHLMQPSGPNDASILVDLLCNYFHGKGGDRPTKSALGEADRIRTAFEKWLSALEEGKDPPKNSMLQATFKCLSEIRAIEMTGNPDTDWRAIRAALEGGNCKRLREVGNEVRNIRLLERGTQLRQDLAQDWRENGGYASALLIVRQAFVQEHFANSAKPESGVVIMNMHKAKGKQFDEVIIFEGWPVKQRGKVVANLDRIVRNNDRSEVNEGVRQNFRVSVTRGRSRTNILTPRTDPCVLLLPEH